MISMPKFLCVQCGTQYAETDTEPQKCLICEDERQYVRWGGQDWTTLVYMREDGLKVVPFEEESGLWGLALNQSFAIGQRALLVPGDKGNILWDCIPFIDDHAIQTVQKLGGLEAIAISHPHYYSTMVEWADAFDVPIYIHQSDANWVMRPSESIVFWEGESFGLTPDIELIHLGGHFAGGSVLLWKQGAEGRGSLLTGDIIQVNQDRHFVSLMYSYPNNIPLSYTEIKRIVSKVETYEFDRIHGAFKERFIWENAKTRVKESAKRYKKYVTN
jgi:glyoxylase-like metal-dependent hydrolase (beta-lactamase superfamily II)